METVTAAVVIRRPPRSTRIYHLPIAAFALVALLVPGLTDAASSAPFRPTKGTEILWDKWGIPHISGPDHASLFYAYGYAQMEAHSELLLRLYAQARGRGAELY